MMRFCAGEPVSLAQSHACPIGDQEVAGLIPSESGNILLYRLIMKYFLQSLPLIQEWQLSVSGERLCTNTG